MVILQNNYNTYKINQISMNCKNCNNEVNLNYCPNCGQVVNIKRINGHYIIHEIVHIFHFERGILYTIKGLITKPGQNIRNYLTENRSRLVKPVIFIIVTSFIYSFCAILFHFEDSYINYSDNKKSAASVIFKWVQGHYGYANISFAHREMLSPYPKHRNNQQHA